MVSARTRRIELLQESYSEVLDAVKHQDDKIGRLLTGLSFLTAATLAVAGLGSAQYVTRRFRVEPWGDLPLALIFLGVFVGGVVLAVSLLLAAFNTPLRLLGERQQGREHDSTIYFFHIARKSVKEWRRTVTKGSNACLEERRIQEFANETHNLAARAKYKHERISEATVILVTAMLALILAAVLTLVAAADQPACDPLPGTSECAPPPPLLITSVTAGLMGLVLTIMVLIKFQTVIRNQRQTPEDLENATEGDWEVAWYTALVAGSLAGVTTSHGWWAGLAVAVMALRAGYVLWRQWRRALSTRGKLDDRQPPVDEIEKKKANRKVGSACAAFFVTTGVGVAALLAALLAPYGVRLLVGVAIYGVLSLSEFVRSLLRARRERIDAPVPERTPQST